MELLARTLCPFCHLDDASVIRENALAVAIHDGFPISPGHALIIPKRHIASFFETDEAERAAFTELLFSMQEIISAERKPDGFNIGINDGATAGQTIFHLHIHLAPRYAGAVPDPRGGVRHIFPDKAAYWK